MSSRKTVTAIVVAVVAIAASAILLWPGRSAGPQPIAYGRDACATCRMIITRPGFGGETRAANGQVAMYDDLGCLLTAASRGDEVVEGWVEDHEGGGFVPMREAHWVKGSAIETPMGHGIVAFRDAKAATAFAASSKATVVPFDVLLAESGRPALADAMPFSEGEAAVGKDLYVRECSACHGEYGRGDGPAAAFLDPKPRNFTRKQFKLRTTATGKAPRSADILGTLERGMPGSAMPSYAALSTDEKRKIGAYVFKLAGLLGTPEPAAVADPGEPPPATAASLERGKALFAEQGCPTCHGPVGKGDGPNSKGLVDAEGLPTRPRDLTTESLRGGESPRAIWYRIFAGMNGSPMPPFAESLEDPQDRWALVQHVESLRAARTEVPFPADAIAAGRAIAATRGCRGCHVLDDGKGGEVGPDLRVSGAKLHPAWVRRFLDDPRAPGKIYPWRKHRMPGIDLAPREIEALARYVTAMGKRSAVAGDPAVPDSAAFPAASLAAGKNVFVLRCSQCHALGKTVQTPLASQQGPDLARVAGRVDYDWARQWILDPRKQDPKTKMTVPGITSEEADAVRMFIWKTSIDEQAASGM